MSAFFEYFRNITYYLIFLTAVGMIAPSDNYRKYMRLIMGILLIGMVIDPIIGVISRQEVPMAEVFAGNMSVPMMTAQIMSSQITADQLVSGQSDHLREIFHRELTAQSEALLARNNFELVSAEWYSAEDFSYIRRVRIVARAMPTEPTPVPFIRIEPVRVAPYQPQKPEDASENASKEELEVKKLLSDFYDMYEGNIHVDILKE